MCKPIAVNFCVYQILGNIFLIRQRWVTAHFLIVIRQTVCNFLSVQSILHSPYINVKANTYFDHTLLAYKLKYVHLNCVKKYHNRMCKTIILLQSVRTSFVYGSWSAIQCIYEGCFFFNFRWAIKKKTN